MNRAVNEEGLKVHKHKDLNLLSASLGDGENAAARLTGVPWPVGPELPRTRFSASSCARWMGSRPPSSG